MVWDLARTTPMGTFNLYDDERNYTPWTEPLPTAPSLRQLELNFGRTSTCRCILACKKQGLSCTRALWPCLGTIFTSLYGIMKPSQTGWKRGEVFRIDYPNITPQTKAVPRWSFANLIPPHGTSLMNSAQSTYDIFHNAMTSHKYNISHYSQKCRLSRSRRKQRSWLESGVGSGSTWWNHVFCREFGSRCILLPNPISPYTLAIRRALFSGA